jgi:hypothetical protein
MNSPTPNQESPRSRRSVAKGLVVALLLTSTGCAQGLTIPKHGLSAAPAPSLVLSAKSSDWINGQDHEPSEPALDAVLVAQHPAPEQEFDVRVRRLQRGRVSFEITVAETGPIRLEVLDPSGWVVQTLLKRQSPRGTSVTEWNGKDFRERVLPKGVYSVRISSGEKTRIVPFIWVP